MPRHCSVCTHPKLSDIDAQLAGSAKSVAWIARRHKLTTAALRRHKANHLTPAVKRVAIEQRREDSAGGIMPRIERLAAQLHRILDRAEERGSIVGAAAVAREIRQGLETIGRVTGELNDRAQISVATIDVFHDRDYINVRTAIIEALEPYPEARLAVGEALRRKRPLDQSRLVRGGSGDDPPAQLNA